MSDKKAGEPKGAEGKRKKAGAGRAGSRTRKRGSDLGRALRSAYDETLREDIPEDFLDLLGKLN